MFVQANQFERRAKSNTIKLGLTKKGLTSVGGGLVSEIGGKPY